MKTRLCRNRPELGTPQSQTSAPTPGIVTNEGGGFTPTLSLGGGAGFWWATRPQVGGGA